MANVLSAIPTSGFNAEIQGAVAHAGETGNAHGLTADQITSGTFNVELIPVASVGVAGVPVGEHTVFLLHGESLTVDDGPYAIALHTGGNSYGNPLPNGVTLGTGKFGGGIQFANLDDGENGITDYNLWADDARFSLLGGEMENAAAHFAVDFWLRTAQTYGMCLFDLNNASYSLAQAYLNASGQVVFAIAGGKSITSTVSVNDGAWRHIECQKSGATIRLFIDGVLAASRDDVTTIAGMDSTQMRVGYSSEAVQSALTGDIDELRVQIDATGAAVVGHTADFTPPVAPYSDEASTGSNGLMTGEEKALLHNLEGMSSADLTAQIAALQTQLTDAQTAQAATQAQLDALEEIAVTYQE